MRIQHLIIFTFLIFIASCKSTMQASYSSQVDPNYKFYTDTYIAVFAAQGENFNTLESKYYIDHVVYSLKQRGFKNVYSYKNLPVPGVNFDAVVYINVSKSNGSYQYETSNYGLIDSGYSTINCTGTFCTQNKQKTLGITGSSINTGYFTNYYFSTSWFSVNSDEKILFSFSSSSQEGCSDRGMYEFLIAQTIDRLNFKEPKEYKYSVDMPSEYSCNY